jgi:enoyl-CoA hydratase/carnithine racemase
LPEIRTERRDAVGIVTIDRPEKRNALSPEVMEELATAIEAFDVDADVRCIVVAGSSEVFAAGADIKAMAERSFQQALEASTASYWVRIGACRTPLVAAVSGFALGGGCELALLCDVIVASDTAEFGQPEITLGIIPGAGGTQRLARTVGKQRAMELVLTGRRIGAVEAQQLGLVNQVATKDDWLEQAIELAHVVARRPPVAAKLAKQAVLAAEEMALSAALAYERRLYELTMATEDRLEGMQAFLEKRKPQFKGR